MDMFVKVSDDAVLMLDALQKYYTQECGVNLDYSLLITDALFGMYMQLLINPNLETDERLDSNQLGYRGNN